MKTNTWSQRKVYEHPEVYQLALLLEDLLVFTFND